MSRAYKLTVQVIGITPGVNGEPEVQSYFEHSDYSDEDAVHTYKTNVVNAAVAAATGGAFADIGRAAGYATSVEEAIEMVKGKPKSA